MNGIGIAWNIGKQVRRGVLFILLLNKKLKHSTRLWPHDI
jgi:hypothetical protein